MRQTESCRTVMEKRERRENGVMRVGDVSKSSTYMNKWAWKCGKIF